MIILTNKLAIRSDVNQWMLCRPGKVSKKSPTGWIGFKFYTSLQAAARGAAQLLLRESAYDTAADLKSNAREIAALLDIKLADLKVTHE